MYGCDHWRWRNQRNRGYMPGRGVWCLAQESMSGKAAVIRGGGIRRIGVTRLIVDFGVWHKRVCQARPCSSEVEELTKWGVCRQAWALAKEITGECTPERGH